MDKLNLSVLNVQLTDLSIFPTQNGDVLHALKKSDHDGFQFGEVYFSFIEQFAVKAWKKHKEMTLNLIVPIGSVRFVFHDLFSEQFLEVELSTSNYKRLTIPPNLWFGFQGLGEKNMVVNVASHEHDPDEVETIDRQDLNFKW